MNIIDNDFNLDEDFEYLDNIEQMFPDDFFEENDQNFSLEKTEKLLTDKEFDNLVIKFTALYGTHEEKIRRRQKLCEYLIGLTREEFVKKLETNARLLFCSEKELTEGVDIARYYFGFTPEQTKRYAMSFYNFPTLEEEKTKQKIEMLNAFGINNEMISLNLGLLRTNYDKLLIRTVLAYVNDIPIEFYCDKGRTYSEEVVWAKMKAKEAGLIPQGFKIYFPQKYFTKQTGIEEKDLTEKFPLDQKALEEIYEKFNNLFESGKPWRNAYKKSTNNINEYDLEK